MLPVDLEAWLIGIRNSSNLGALTNKLDRKINLGERGSDLPLGSNLGRIGAHRPCSMAKLRSNPVIFEIII